MNAKRFAILIAALFCVAGSSVHETHAGAGQVGINVILDGPPSSTVLADLAKHGTVLDLLPQINGVTMRAAESELPAIRASAHVAGANPDVMCFLDGAPDVADFSEGANPWNLDAIDVADGAGRTVSYDGEGVYVAVIDSGLPHNWRESFPEERIDTVHACAFGGGGGEKATVSSQPVKWEKDTNGHGAAIAGVILGFRYAGPEALPSTFDGVAPKATVIPIRTLYNANWSWASLRVHAMLYVTDLKRSGALGDAPVVINVSGGSLTPQFEVLQEAAIDYAIANGVVVVASAGNHGSQGMAFPARYPPVISVAATGWVEQWLSGQTGPVDPTSIEWCLRDVPEDDATAHFVADFSSRALAGQDLDVAAPGTAVPTPWTQDGRVDYTFFWGTSAACPHVVGVVALMLQKNPTLVQSDIEEILENTTLALPPDCAALTAATASPGDPPTWSDHGNVGFFQTTFCWDASATGHGLVQADAALAATPLP